MIIALDYDETYTEDPELWNSFIKSANDRGHEVLCVTMRYNNIYEAPDVLETVGKLCRVIFTERLAKEEYVKSHGINPDIWIDDRPYYIYQNSRNI